MEGQQNNEPSPFSQFCIDQLSPLQMQQSPQGMQLDSPPFGQVQLPAQQNNILFESAPIVGKKAQCKCLKSHCLQLYCDCFAMSEYCLGCGCFGCKNIPEHEEERRVAIQITLERNSNAFYRVGGMESEFVQICNCRQSGCEKKYCVCFSNGNGCTAACKCINCFNNKPI